MVDRERELRALRKGLSSDSFELIILYVRRIGKTFLILNAVSGCDFLYYLATEKNKLRKSEEVVRGKYGEVKHVRGLRVRLTTCGR